MDNRVHALSHEMESKSTRTQFACGEALKGFGLGFCSMVEQDNFQTFFRTIFRTNFIEANLDGAVQFAAVSVANNVGYRLIHRERDGAAILFAKTHDPRNRRNSTPDTT